MKFNKKYLGIVVAAIIITGGFFMILSANGQKGKGEKDQNFVIDLPDPVLKSNVSLEEAISKRRSVRSYKDEPVSLAEISQLLWSAQGITEKSRGLRAAPSAGATYPLNLYLIVGRAEGVPQGVYRYDVAKHRIVRILEGDVRESLKKASHGQDFLTQGAISILISGIYERTTERYGERGIKYTHYEAGHTAQNLHLQAIPLNLGTVLVGAFKDDEVKKIIPLAPNEEPFYIMPFGRI